MAKSTGKSDVLAKLKKKGLKKAHKKHKDDPVSLPSGGGELPSGIKGIAQLVQAEISTHDDGDNKGEPYAIFSGVVKKPSKHRGEKVEGRRATIFIPLYDTPNRRNAKTFDDHWATFLNELKKFKVDMDFDPEEDTDEVLKDLVEEAPYFHFSTWGGGEYKDREGNMRQGRVNIEFGELAEYEEGDEDEDEEVIEDDEEEGEEEEVEEEEEEEEVDYKKLGKAADKKDEDAQETLSNLAEEAGLDPDDYPTWAKLAKALEEGAEGEEEEEEPEEEEEEEDAEPPEKGDVKVYDDSEVEVVKVNKRSQTANVKDIESGKVTKDVPWSDLSDE